VKALVTGANGFLGAHLVRQLVQRGDKVVALTRRRDAALSASPASHIHADIRDFDALLATCRDVDVVFHTAGVSGIWGSWKHFHSNNTIGTRNVVEACLRNKIPRLVYTSSPSVTFRGEHQLHVDESAEYAKRWLCHYPHSKALAEQHVLDANDSSGLRTCALRPHLIWGPGDSHLIPRLLERARAKTLRRVGDGSNRIDTIYVENAAAAHIQAAEALESRSPVCGATYFLSQDDPVNCWGWINEILALAGLPRVRQSISYRWAYRLGLAMETYHEMFNIQREPPMTRFLAAQLAKSHYYDISRAKRDFGYNPHVSNEEGMKRLAASFAL
jgi:nucleoside-diphosphate-sugar epimerase